MFELLKYLILFLMFGVPLGCLVLSWWLYIRPWKRAFFHGLNVNAFDIIFCRKRGNPVDLILDAMFQLHARNESVSFRDVKNAYILRKHKITTCGDLAEFAKQEVTLKEVDHTSGSGDT